VLRLRTMLPGLAHLTSLLRLALALALARPATTGLAGAAASTAVAAERTVTLDGPGWTLSNANGSVSVPAVVPGDAHAALAAAGLIGDIYYRFNDAKYSWVANESWAWRRALPPLLASSSGSSNSSSGGGAGKWVLVCEGLQTIGRVSVGGHVLGHVNNQYRRWEYPLPVGAGGQELRLEFQSISQLAPTRCGENALFCAHFDRKTTHLRRRAEQM
jgi:beta-galactosidase/beta-glucuronidase